MATPTAIVQVAVRHGHRASPRGLFGNSVIGSNRFEPGRASVRATSSDGFQGGVSYPCWLDPDSPETPRLVATVRASAIIRIGVPRFALAERGGPGRTVR